MRTALQLGVPRSTVLHRNGVVLGDVNLLCTAMSHSVLHCSSMGLDEVCLMPLVRNKTVAHGLLLYRGVLLYHMTYCYATCRASMSNGAMLCHVLECCATW